METIEITTHKSLCCKALIHYKHIEIEIFKSSTPYCSKCGKFPEASKKALKEALKSLKNQ